jgi:hypothetical protein
MVGVNLSNKLVKKTIGGAEIIAHKIQSLFFFIVLLLAKTKLSPTADVKERERLSSSEVSACPSLGVGRVVVP